VRIIPDLVYSTTYESVNISEKFRSKNCKNTTKAKEILQILSSTDFGVEGKSEILCRINDVSRNHRSQLFRIRLTCEQGDNTETLYTRPIKVVSKHPKSKSTNKKDLKVGSKNPRSQATNKRKHSCGPEPERKRRTASTWSSRAFQFLKNFQPHQIGFYDAKRTKPIVQCPSCRGLNTPICSQPQHKGKCPLVQLISDGASMLSDELTAVSAPEEITADTESDESTRDVELCPLVELSDGALDELTDDALDELTADTELTSDTAANTADILSDEYTRDVDFLSSIFFDDLNEDKNEDKCAFPDFDDFDFNLSTPVDWLKFNKNFNKKFQCENNKISSFLGSRPFFGSEETGMDTIHELYVRLPKSIHHHLVLLTATTCHQVIATVVILFC